MKSFFVLLIILSLAAPLLNAQETQTATKDTTVYYLSPVVVNPAHAVERETPATFSNLDKKQIEERYSVQDIPVLLSELPSVTTYSENGNGIGYNYINLRGFDQRRLSVMINGIPQNDPEDHNVYWIDFPDLLGSTSDIQVQRGAGSAFYGPPAIGGSINLITTPFTAKRGIKLESVFGFQEFGGSETKQNTNKYEVAINSGLIERQYMLYGKLSKITSSGYREHSWVDLRSYYLGAVRFDNTMTTRFHFFGGPFSDGLAYIGVPKFYNDDLTLRRSNYSYWEADSTGDAVGYSVQQKPQAVEKFSQPHYELIHEWRKDSNLTLVNTLFYYTGAGSFDYDGDWVWFDNNASDWFHNKVGYDSAFGVSKFPSFILRGFVENKHWGWLPRVDLNFSGAKLTLGGELRFHRSTHWGSIPFASEYPHPMFDPDFHFYQYNGLKDILSVFAHTIVNPIENLSIMGDLQLVHNRYGIETEKFLGHQFDYDYLFLNPRLGANYNIDSQWNTYLSLAYTSREPRLKNLYAAEEAFTGATPQFELTPSSPPGTAVYDYTKPFVKPEQLFDIELGMGYREPGAKFTANVFWMEFTDELIKSGGLDIFGQPRTGNAERSRHIGLELDGSATLNEELSINGNLTLSRNRLVTHTIYVDGTDSVGNSVILPQSLDGNSIAGFPDVLWNVRVTYNYKRVTSSIIAKYVGSFYTDNFEDGKNKNDESTIINFEFLYRLPRFIGTEFTLRGEVRNLLNKLYMMNGEGNSFYPAAERNYLIGITANL